MRLQAELASLSTNGRQVVANESGHLIHADDPQLVIDAVTDLVRQAAYRAGTETP